LHTQWYVRCTATTATDATRTSQTDSTQHPQHPHLGCRCAQWQIRLRCTTHQSAHARARSHSVTLKLVSSTNAQRHVCLCTAMSAISNAHIYNDTTHFSGVAMRNGTYRWSAALHTHTVTAHTHTKHHTRTHPSTADVRALAYVCCPSAPLLQHTTSTRTLTHTHHNTRSDKPIATKKPRLLSATVTRSQHDNKMTYSIARHSLQLLRAIKLRTRASTHHSHALDHAPMLSSQSACTNRLRLHLPVPARAATTARARAHRAALAAALSVAGVATARARRVSRCAVAAASHLRREA
jgi:hypothetical protein